ncbi:MAG: DUF4861 domain-containing protein [Bacteroidales bacterium]|nr:DUF4861 domain-containing protein [Bacteroidales bacterium]
MKQILFSIISLALLASCKPSSTTIEVVNKGDFERQEMVEVPTSDMGLDADKTYVLRDSEGKEVEYQLTHDARLIFLVDFGANESKVYTFSEGKPADVARIAEGKVYPNRVDDIAWENDRIAFRAYGPALQASKERAYGYDVWAKRVSEPVVDARYEQELNPETTAKIAALKAEGKADEAAELYHSVSYHVDHGNGLDCYKVGPTLGGGASALVVNDAIIYPYCYKTCEILDNGPLRFSVKLTYCETEIDGEMVTEVRTITLDKGEQLNKTTVKYLGLTKETTVVAGPVCHHADGGENVADAEAGYVAYADPTDNPNNDNGTIYVGAAFPELNDAKLVLFDEEEAADRGANGHVLGYMTYKPGETLTYYWGGGWSKWGFESFEAWDTYMKTAAKRIKSPLSIIVG